MSSHHIVRDQQEPALLIHRLTDFDTNQLHGLLEWSPTVVCCEPALERYLELGHKVDIALVSLSRNEFWQSSLQEQQPVKIVAINDVQYMITGLTILEKEQHKAINVVTNADSVFEVIDELSDWMHLMEIVVFAEDNKYIFIRDGQFTKWLHHESGLTLNALSQGAEWNTIGFDEDVRAFKAQDLEFVKSREGEVRVSCSVPFLIIEAL